VRERLLRTEPTEPTGGAGSDLLLAALAYYQARLGVDRELCLELAEQALRSRALEHGSAFGLYYALLAVGGAGELQAAPGGRSCARGGGGGVDARAGTGPPAGRSADHAQHADLEGVLRVPAGRASGRRIGRARGPGARRSDRLPAGERLHGRIPGRDPDRA